jgi:hypothetical protein
VSLGEGQTLEAVPKTGATLDSESGRPLAAMAAAALGVPVTILLADPGVTGARATAETLDLPTPGDAGPARGLGAGVPGLLRVRHRTGRHRPPRPLKGKVERTGTGCSSTLATGTDPTVEVIWPDLAEIPLDILMGALEKANDMDLLPRIELLKLVLRALNIRDIDDILDDLTDADGNLIDPGTSAGELAAKAFRDGQDPAAALK